jgi:hypothetical protein
MLRWIADLWWNSTPAEFESSFGLNESVERLTAATRRSMFSSLSQQEAVGKVTEMHVSLQRVIPLVRNSFKPFYRGHFIERNEKVILSGKFTMHWLAKVFLTFWFGGAACFTLFTLATISHASMFLPLCGLGMMSAGVGLVALSKWFARNDAAWLSDIIRGALCAPVGRPCSSNSESR